MQHDFVCRESIDPSFKVRFPDDPQISVRSLYIWHHMPDDFSRALFMSLLACPDPYEELDELIAVRVSEFLHCFVQGLASIGEIEGSSWYAGGKHLPSDEDYIRHFLYGNLSFDDLEAYHDQDGDDGVACNAANLEHLRSRFSVDTLTPDFFDLRQPVSLADFVVEFYDVLATMLSTRSEVEYDR